MAVPHGNEFTLPPTRAARLVKICRVLSYSAIASFLRARGDGRYSPTAIAPLAVERATVSFPLLYLAPPLARGLAQRPSLRLAVS